MIKRIRVGVKSPVIGTGMAVLEAAGLGVKVETGFIVEIGVAVAFGLDVGEAEGDAVAPDPDAVNAGASPA